MPPHLARAFRASSYRVAGIDMRIGRRSAALDGVLQGMGVREAVLISASNPRSRRMPPGWNARMTAKLHAALGRTPALPGESGAGVWREAQFLAAAPARRARGLARRFRQYAIVRVQPGRGPHLVTVA